MIYLALFIIISFFVALLALIWATSAVKSVFLGAPIIGSSKVDIIQALKLASPKSGQKLIDLGCGDGRVLVIACQKFHLYSVGYEATFWGWLISNINIFRFQLSDRLKVNHQSLFDADLKEIDIVYLYLLPRVLTKLAPKLSRELKPGAKIISYAFPLPDWPPNQVQPAVSNPKVRIYLYQIN